MEGEAAAPPSGDPGQPDYYWSMDSMGATVPADIGGQPFTVVGAPQLDAGIINQAFNNDPNTGYLENTDAVFAFNDTQFSIACWVKLNLAGNVTILDHEGDGTRHYKIQSDTTNGFTFYAQNGTGTNVFSTIIPSAGVWYFVVGYHDSVANLIGISVNADAFVTAAHSFGTGSLNAFLRIAKTSGNIVIDELGIWTNTVLTSDNVDFLYNSGAGRSYA